MLKLLMNQSSDKKIHLEQKNFINYSTVSQNNQVPAPDLGKLWNRYLIILRKLTCLIEKKSFIQFFFINLTTINILTKNIIDFSFPLFLSELLTFFLTLYNLVTFTYFRGPFVVLISFYISSLICY